LNENSTGGPSIDNVVAGGGAGLDEDDELDGLGGGAVEDDTGTVGSAVPLAAEVLNEYRTSTLPGLSS
jgi:hypothetical protein